jgi:regulator of sirC expression with transglutaminase-like and TPR domain
VSARAEAERILRRAGGQQDVAIDLAETALALAAWDAPAAQLQPYRDHLDALAGEVAAAFAQARADGAEDDVAARSRALASVLAERHGYCGDRETYDDLRNASLMGVIDRRQGLPVALAILYVHAARAQGWPIAGLNFPGHFLLAMTHAGERAVLDPFDGLRPLGRATLRRLLQAVQGPEAELAPEHTRSIGNRAMLLRLHNNRKVRLLRDGRTEQALDALQAMLALAPEDPGLWRDSGLLQARQGNLRAAIRALEKVRTLAQDPAARDEAEDLLRQLRQRIN